MKEQEPQTKQLPDAQKFQNDQIDQGFSVSGSSVTSQQSQPQEQIKQKPQNAEVKPLPGAYKASDYAGLNVSNDINELFKYIQRYYKYKRYKPQTIQIETKIKAFIPDYIPTVGQVDAFLKMNRVNQEQKLGLAILDEPALNQSDKAKIQILIRNTLKQKSDNKIAKVYSIENAQKNPKQIQVWINSAAEIQKSKKPPSVSYSKPMPDIDNLMQIWPPQIEQILQDFKFPSEQIDLSLEDYCKLACNLVDIPIHNSNQSKNIIQSLHVLFILYSAFTEIEHFNQNQNF